VTVHKSQGGEWPVVVLVCDRSHRAMLWRNLVYTAMTRARRALIVVGQAEALRDAAARTDRSVRRPPGWPGGCIGARRLAQGVGAFLGRDAACRRNGPVISLIDVGVDVARQHARRR
jgi:hypothetical protein